ncbi:hypothetical protein BDY17DRAFT_116207 [Neohortaea acidophila]|uniref:Uncharacterized protein n=1 Tax=Neohortaea acidophila TaxID=245834 RepID=A0A6A6PVM9_9PEZI|nr:uncharacterized protein BDY17DRAFT_116207 [Neohortaea acidophila]KAF2483826.1 hypothetical protein BDY17DRAFT_116207 [Neohortaea acidophila]
MRATVAESFDAQGGGTADGVGVMFRRQPSGVRKLAQGACLATFPLRTGQEHGGDGGRGETDLGMQGSLVFGRRVVKGGGRSVCEEGMFPAVCRSAAIARNTAVSPICGEALGTWAKPARLHCTLHSCMHSSCWQPDDTTILFGEMDRLRHAIISERCVKRVEYYL